MKNITGKSIVDIALAGREPVKELLDIARKRVENREIADLYDIDVMLSERYIEFLRRGTPDDLESFVRAMLSFTDCSIGDKLKADPEGSRYFHRWDHFHDLCEMAVENYDPAMLKRFIKSRSHGPGLMEILRSNDEGVRFKDLAVRLGLTEQYLAKLLREFEEHDLVVRERRNKVSTVKLGFVGRAYVAESGVTERNKKASYQQEQDGLFYQGYTPAQYLDIPKDAFSNVSEN